MKSAVFALALVSMLVACGGARVERSGPAPREARVASPLAAPTLPIGAQAWSLLGAPLYAPALSSLEHARRVAALDAARRALEQQPEDADARIWVGRRLGYLGRFREAIDTFTAGVDRHPEDARFLRHRGHRHISVREFDNAVRDLERAAELVRGSVDEIEPDGMPNARGIPLETLHSNIHYHLGLARFLLGDYPAAERAFRDAFAAAGNFDNQCSATHWLHIALRRQGKQAEAERALAAVRDEREIVEYQGYFQLCRAYQGVLDIDAIYADARRRGGVEAASVGYGAGAWHADHGRSERAEQVFREVLASDASYAFGFIAAEVEIARRSR